MQIIYLCIINLQIINQDLTIKHSVFIFISKVLHRLSFYCNENQVTQEVRSHSKIYSEKRPIFTEKREKLMYLEGSLYGYCHSVLDEEGRTILA